MQLTQEQEKKIKRIAKLVDFETKGAVVLIEDIFALEDKIPELKELVEELKKERPNRDEIKEIVSELIGGIEIPEAINGEKGDKGDGYILTEDDKKEIASKIKVPIVEKIIEKTEVKIEQPIEIIKEVAVITDEAITSRGEAIRDGLELLQDDDRLDKKAIKGLDDYEEVAKLAKASQFLNRGGNGKGLLSQMNDVNIQSPTDNQVLKYNATTGLWENDTDAGGLTNPVDYLQFNTSATPQPNAEGLLQWNATDGTLDLGMDGGAITQQIGQELFTKVRNAPAYQTILNGQAVYISGRTGVYPDVRLARSDSDTTSRVLGIATQDITSPDFGFITTTGYVRGIKTNYTGTGTWGTTWVTGDMLYVSKTNAGVLTNVEPSAPHHSDTVGSVGIVHATQGSILVNLDRHKTLEELTDVNGTTPVDGSVPSYHAAEGYFDFDKNINDYLKLDQTIDAQSGLGQLQFGQFVASGYGTYDYYGLGQAYFRERVTTRDVFKIGEPCFTYNVDGTLQRIDCLDGSYKEFTYNVDGTLNTINLGGFYTKTLTWSSGKLQNIIVT